MVSLGVVEQSASLGIVITAVIIPQAITDINLKEILGPLLPDQVQEVEDCIPDSPGLILNKLTLKKVEYIALEGLYVEHAIANFEFDIINNSNLSLAYDPMFGAGKAAMPRLLPKTKSIHVDDNPGFHGTAPEPIHRNLQEFSNLIKDSGNIDCGLATDGDADRIGLYNKSGKFIDYII